MIVFNRAPINDKSKEYAIKALESHSVCGDGEYTKACSRMLKDMTGAGAVLLTTSCTHATEMTALLANIQPEDEIIMPSYTFVSTANAFVLRKAKVIFVDIRPDTMNIDESLIEQAITKKTKAIVPVHYAGVSCEMDRIMEIARDKKLTVIEDAAQGICSTYHGVPLGTIGDYGCFSFHETKNLSMGEGGALLIKDIENLEKAEIIREKGTNRSKFFRGQIDKYTWVEAGSSYLPSDINAAYLLGQLEDIDNIQKYRMNIWDNYYKAFSKLADKGAVELPAIPENCSHNAHMFYLKLRDLDTRSRFIEHMKAKGVLCVFHYIPLHLAPAGKKYGEFIGEDRYTKRESERLVRLPLYYGLENNEQEYIIESALDFFR